MTGSTNRAAEEPLIQVLMAIATINERLDAFDTRATERHARIDEEFREVYSRLSDGDKKFHKDDISKAARDGAERLAIRIGYGVLIALLGVISWTAAHVGDTLINIILPPKH